MMCKYTLKINKGLLIKFSKNINGIVGLNKSGKSNKVDDVRQLLIGQSMNNLRKDSSLDVLFSDNDSRKHFNSNQLHQNLMNTIPIMKNTKY